jgi:hypothetical protein
VAFKKVLKTGWYFWFGYKTVNKAKLQSNIGKLQTDEANLQPEEGQLQSNNEQHLLREG